MYEERVVDLVSRTKHLPQHMAEHGTVRISAKDVAKLIGQVGRRPAAFGRGRRLWEGGGSGRRLAEAALGGQRP